jgi:SAM-dependent methyltransferase
VERTIDWIVSTAGSRRNLLDLGCGPGIYANQLHDRGFKVTGIDISQNSIAYARDQAAKTGKEIEYRVQDYVHTTIQGRYDIALCIYCDVGALIPDELDLFLKNVSSALEVGGLFMFDVFGPGLCDCRHVGKSWAVHPNGGFWSNRPHLEFSEDIHDQQKRTWGTRTVVIEEGVPAYNAYKEYITWDLYYDEETLLRVLNNHGFVIDGIRTDLIPPNSFTSNDVLFVKARKTT